MNIRTILLFALLLFPAILKGQETKTEVDNGIIVDYDKPKQYIVGGLEVTGIKYLGRDQIVALTGIQIGQTITIPSEEISEILKRLYLQRFTSSVALFIDSLSSEKDTAFLRLDLQERPRVSRWNKKFRANGFNGENES